MPASFPESPEPVNPGEMPFLEHLVELRQRLMYSLLAVLLIFLALFPFDDFFFTLLADPLLRYLPEGTQMVAIDPTGPFLVPLKLVLAMAGFLAMPVILYHLWAFIAPGLYQHEKRLARPLLVSSIVLFYLGMAFAYFVVFPLVFHFFVSVVPAGVEMSTDINRYLGFVLKMFFAFGVAFEVPVATVLIVLTGMASVQSLADKRPYIIVAAFVIGMLLTPPDAFSQILLAVPMWMLFESGLILAGWLQRQPASTEMTEASETPEGVDANEDIARYRTPSDEELDQIMDSDGWHVPPADPPKEP